MLYQIKADSQNGNVVRLYGVVGGCGSMDGLIDYVGLCDLYCDLL